MPAAPLSLLQKQHLFSYNLALLLAYAYSNGYQISVGEAWRSPEEAARLAKSGAGIAASLHCDKLAIDLSLFKDGRYLKTSEEYGLLGEYWKRLHPLCRWGGDFTTRPDGNHFSITHGGRL